ncbi:hypothetical protein OZX74_04060 [Bifidobacterium sp. ESL0798]|uniref:hypothetical protein n=1 Tax=Bifidobacterium sp. ESL0798 TaxID=2983235 RepID=UPI0023F82A23|nr:hypothetical protein [Bifidobacterium sp. ESL0798]WEV74700.1 hypothetical protein OZX74_04060 [Bifidobacterium sp. ESL0798]
MSDDNSKMLTDFQLALYQKKTVYDYDFTLTPPLMDEFVDAANAYGQHWKWFGIYATTFITVICCMGIANGRLLDFGQNKFILFGCGLLLLIALTLVGSRSVRHLLTMSSLFYEFQAWFPSAHDRSAIRQLQWRQITHRTFNGPEWRTPCRVSVSQGGVHMVRWVSDRVYEDGCPWEQVECVRVTPHAIVLGPSAWSKAHTTRLDGDLIKIGDVSHCVVIPRKSVGNVDQFVADCWMHILAVRPDLRKPLSCRTRFRRWLHGDDL